ncbi:hypothetical protein [Demetria terragena]|uniref:hypothetical protein n=1 Tax=Demetria terragena TaxID=63959 RepID=UPI000376FB11|nr:hypothetical protein [Demetria terragena]
MSYDGYGSQQPPEGNAGDPYAYDPTRQPPPGQTHFGQSPSQYGLAPQGYQSYPQFGIQHPYHRPVWKVLLAVVCFLFAALVLLGMLGALAAAVGGSNTNGDDSAAYLGGQIIGLFIFLGIGGALIAGGVALLRTPRRYR